MRYAFVLLISCALAAGCSLKKDDEQPADRQPQQQTATPVKPSPAPANQDISTSALAAIDPEIQKYQDSVDKAKKLYDTKKNDAARSELASAYVAFGDYMTYQSPVSPRQGKYRRALLEYRRAVALDPSNQKALNEISQIEDIYSSMGRPVPHDPI